MSRPKADNMDPRAIAMDLFKRLDGMAGMTKWGKTHRSLAYQLIAKLMAQPLVTNNVNIANITHDDGSARRKLEDAFMRIIAANKASVGDPAVYVNDMRLGDDGRLIEHQPQPPVPPPLAADPRPATPDVASESKSASSGSPISRGGVDATPGATSPGGGTKQKPMNSLSRMPSVPGLYAGAALDESADNRSTTEKYLSWTGHGRPP
jgi:hypothetical protein